MTKGANDSENVIAQRRKTSNRAYTNASGQRGTASHNLLSEERATSSSELVMAVEETMK